MSSRDQEIYGKIGSILYKNAPQNAKKVIMIASLSSNETACEFRYHFIDEDNDRNWFLPNNGGKIAHVLCELLLELKSFFLAQNQPSWKGCEFGVDMESGKFQLEFIFE
jgi:hypothetical protein